MIDDEVHERIEDAILAAVGDELEGGRKLVGIHMTWAMFENLGDLDHWREAQRIIAGSAPAGEFYQLPVSLYPGAHHAWELKLARV